MSYSNFEKNKKNINKIKKLNKHLNIFYYLKK